MSLHSFTIDQLMQLTLPTLEYALRVFQKELDGYLDLLKEKPEAADDDVLLSDFSNLLTLRKVFKHRLEELVEEAAAQPAAPQTALATAA